MHVKRELGKVIVETSASVITNSLQKFWAMKTREENKHSVIDVAILAVEYCVFFSRFEFSFALSKRCVVCVCVCVC